MNCPNGCGELNTTKFSDLETADGMCFDVWITYCSECGYIESAEAE